MRTRLLKPTDRNISQTANIIKRGGIVAFPTETVYGLGANVFDAKAVAKIFSIKKRPAFDPLIVHVSGVKQALTLIDYMPGKARKLMETFWPGPLTIVLNKHPLVPGIVTGGLDTIAIRAPENKIALQLIKKSGTAIAAPSANPFGYLSPTNASHVTKMLSGKIDAILDGGQARIGIESTIVKFQNDKVYLLRSGGLPVKDLNRIIGRIHRPPKNKRMISPGRMKKHYSPATRVKVLTKGTRPKATERYALVLYSKQSLKNPSTLKVASRAEDVRWLTVQDSLIEASSNFFETLHKLDSYSLDTIYIQKAPDRHLGVAINERISKMSE